MCLLKLLSTNTAETFYNIQIIYYYTKTPITYNSATASLAEHSLL